MRKSNRGALSMIFVKMSALLDAESMRGTVMDLLRAHRVLHEEVAPCYVLEVLLGGRVLCHRLGAVVVAVQWCRPLAREANAMQQLTEPCTRRAAAAAYATGAARFACPTPPRAGLRSTRPCSTS